ncbi:MAG: histidine kinase [Arcobacter sp.]|uniref:7TM diverse intracellular signaling domain-containing protein n=1 Tax=uncultured Arcobacter sp. TaxID=165434 RepID=UPI000CCB4107|nr:7TM diverse intracellular signaling domain-containing protein [uncultured Arcobacter sp.]PLY11483.1 MAG: histidine kinase [Arcobacter sp.]
MKHLKIIFFLFITTFIYANPVTVDNQTKFINLLPHSEIFLDRSRNMTIDEIDNSSQLFKKNDKKLLGFGYSPDFDVWIKFTLKNNTDKVISKILEYDNPLTTNIEFYNPNKNYKKEEDGLSLKNLHETIINPIFIIELKPKESSTYYVKASSFITTLIVKLNLWNSDSFYNKEIKHQLILALFFGAMLILALYNLFIFFFTRDISYLYYVVYMIGLIIHHLLYVGIANAYFLTSENMTIIISMASFFVALPVYGLGLFTKSFLQTSQYPIHNKILNLFLILIPISIGVFLLTQGYDKYRNSITMIFLIFLMYITIYATIKRNKQAYFILFGWFIFLSSGILMFLSSAGIFDIYGYSKYLIEISFLLEAVIFSVALANRINSLQKEKNEVNQKLIIQQQNETKRLEKSVEEKTKDLKYALDEKELLLKELNHRVKNNMQTIVSLIRLQNDEIEDKKLQDILITIQNRINAMGHLHELLYNQNDITDINAYEYFDLLIEEIKDSYESDIEINFDIQTRLKIEQAIYCGLIINELVTNSLKYAFPAKEGNITISLKKIEQNVQLIIKDDGIGFDEKNKKQSLGLTLVNTLCENQLGANIKIQSNDGVTITIIWEDNE